MIKLPHFSRKIQVLFVVGLFSLLSLIYLFYSLSPKKTETLLPVPTPTPFFTTPPPELIEQTKEDRFFGQTVESQLKNIPFLTSLPIITDKYTIIFDFEQNKIRVRLKTGITRSQVESEINIQLKQIGADLKKYPIYYLP